MRWLSLGVLFISLVNCKSIIIKKSINKKLNCNFNKNHFTGIFVYNPQTKDTLINYNGYKFFTPASNTKIATLYTGLQLLEDKIPSYTYSVTNDTISIQGTGNPTFLHPFFKDSSLIKTLKKYQHIKIFTSNLKDEKYGAGWAWEDYDTYFSPERSAFPIYGNVVHIYKKDSLTVIPKIFGKTVILNDKKQGRDETNNIFYYKNNRTKPIEIPFIINNTSSEKLWKKIFPNTKLTFFHDSIISLKNTAYNDIPMDSLYKRMMIKSDNFLAEQILIMASSKLSSVLSSKRAREYIIKNNLADLKNKPKWVDGSGLSRYNLFTPDSFVQILNKMYTNIPKKRLFNLFPIGGVSGTLKNWYKGEDKPYVYAKSGTLSNNYSLSGYLISKSGKTLIFSIMNNHYRKKTNDIKKQTQQILEVLRDNY